MELYPVFLKLENKLCVVAGGGKVAERKILSLIGTGARINVVSPDWTEGIGSMEKNRTITLVKRHFAPADIEGAVLVIAATDSPEANKLIYETAETSGIPVNTVDVPENCSFFVPACVKRGSLQVAISTSGKAPYFARHLRQYFETFLYPELAEDLEKLHELRKKILETSPSEAEKSALFKKLLDPEIETILGRISKK